jgi:hypothetical protein
MLMPGYEGRTSPEGQRRRQAHAEEVSDIKTVVSDIFGSYLTNLHETYPADNWNAPHYNDSDKDISDIIDLQATILEKLMLLYNSKGDRTPPPVLNSKSDYTTVLELLEPTLNELRRKPYRAGFSDAGWIQTGYYKQQPQYLNQNDYDPYVDAFVEQIALELDRKWDRNRPHVPLPIFMGSRKDPLACVLTNLQNIRDHLKEKDLDPDA